MTSRPWVGGSLGLLGAAIMLVAGNLALAAAPEDPQVSDVLTYTIELTAGVFVLVAASLALARPEHHRPMGYVAAAFSLLSLFGATGALCFGSLLGVLGAAGILAWIPVTSLWHPRPAEAFAIALTAVFFVHIATALGAIGPYPLRKFPPNELLPGVVAEAALFVGAVMLYRRPHEHRVWGVLLFVGSVLAVSSPYAGFLLGPALGFTAAVLAIRWKGG